MNPLPAQKMFLVFSGMVNLEEPPPDGFQPWHTGKAAGGDGSRSGMGTGSVESVQEDEPASRKSSKNSLGTSTGLDEGASEGSVAGAAIEAAAAAGAAAAGRAPALTAASPKASTPKPESRSVNGDDDNTYALSVAFADEDSQGDSDDSFGDGGHSDVDSASLFQTTASQMSETMGTLSLNGDHEEEDEGARKKVEGGEGGAGRQA